MQFEANAREWTDTVGARKFATFGCLHVRRTISSNQGTCIGRCPYIKKTSHITIAEIENTKNPSSSIARDCFQFISTSRPMLLSALQHELLLTCLSFLALPDIASTLCLESQSAHVLQDGTTDAARHFIRLPSYVNPAQAAPRPFLM